MRLAFRLAAYPNRIAGVLVFGLAGAIMVNALMLQHARHPAPLFRKSINLPMPQAPAHAPHEKPRVTEAVAPSRDPISQLLKSETPASRPAAEQEKTRPPQRHNGGASEHAAVTAVRPAAHDPISQLLKAGPSRTSHSDDQPKLVLGVQRALVKLGFVLRADGHMGAVTRHAIEQYERDRGLQVRDELTPKLVHQLAIESGVTIE